MHHADAHHSHGHTDDHHDRFDTPEMVDMAETEATLFADLAEQAIDAVREADQGSARPIRRILDLGCGPGVTAIALASSFRTAQVHALDGSERMLERAAARAAATGFTDRVVPVKAAFPDGAVELPPIDLVWASQMLHHAGNDILRAIRGTLAPEGLVVILEPAGPIRPRDDEDLPRRTLWNRVDAAWESWFEASWGPGIDGITLRTAGLEIIARRRLRTSVVVPDPGPEQSLVRRHLAGLAENLAEFLTGRDVDELRQATAGDSIRDLLADRAVTATRTLVVATRGRVTNHAAEK